MRPGRLSASEMDTLGVVTTRPPRSRARLAIMLTLLLPYAVLVSAATLSPNPLDSGLRSAIDRALVALHHHGLPGWFGYASLESSANVAMFIPLGFLISLSLPQRLWWFAFAICPALSLAIELTQYALLSGRFATADDVIANAVGGAIGAPIAALTRMVVHRRDAHVVAWAEWTRRVSSAEPTSGDEF